MKISVFTPCFNCSNYIPELANCIINQTFKDFEWIIYNDGSTDNTDLEIQRVIRENPNLDIKYINEEVNKGKHIAWNRAVEVARGELFICADADDPFEYDSLDFYNQKWELAKADSACCGILGLVNTLETGMPHAGLWPSDDWKINYLDFLFKYDYHGETWGVTRTDLLKGRPFPEIAGACFPEHYIWQWLGLNGFYYNCYNHVTRHYRTQSPGSLMATEKKRLLSPPQLQINIITLLWELKYTSRWYLKYKKKTWIKKIFFELPKNIYLYLFKSKTDKFL